MTPAKPVTNIRGKTIAYGVIASLILAFLLLQIVFAQTQTAFKPTDKFSIPEFNGTINFAAVGGKLCEDSGVTGQGVGGKALDYRWMIS